MASILGTAEQQPGIGLASTASAQASSAETAETDATSISMRTSKDAAYRINVQDVLDVSVFKVPELSKSVRASLLQSLATAEGLEPNSDSAMVVFSHADGNRLAARFEVDNIWSGQAEGPVPQGSDVVVVGTSAIKENLQQRVEHFAGRWCVRTVTRTPVRDNFG
jgi:hypothetical protein